MTEPTDPAADELRATSPRRLRLTVSGPTELIVQLPPATAATGTGPQPQLLPRTAADAAAARLRAEVIVDGWRFIIVAEDARLADLRDRAARAAAAHHRGGHALVRAQIPGRITRVWVAETDTVEKGQRLLAIEAMKMENEIRAPRAGVIEKLAVGEGELVELNDNLLTIGEPTP